MIVVGPSWTAVTSEGDGGPESEPISLLNDRLQNLKCIHMNFQFVVLRKSGLVLTCRPLAVVTLSQLPILSGLHDEIYFPYNIVHKHLESINPSSVNTEIYRCFYVLYSNRLARHAF